MNEETERTFWRHRPHSLFFPLLLIGVGVVLLLKTLGLITGDVWQMFLTGWPVLLIVSGLDSIYRRDGIVGGVVWAGLGVIILLANLGYLPPLYWNVVLRIWPFAFVVWGLDLLLSHRAWWTAVLAFLAGVVVLGLVYWVMMASPVNRSVEAQTFEIQPGAAKQADVNVEFIAGRLSLQDGAAEGNLADGQAELPANETLTAEYSVQGDTGTLSLARESGNDFQYWMPGASNQYDWQVNLTETLPLDLNTRLVIGDQTADLSALQLNDADMEVVMGRSSVVLPEQAGGVLDISLVMGESIVYIPQGAPVSIELDTAITAISYPDDFTRSEDRLISPNGDEADALQVRLGLVMGSLQIRYIEN